MGVSLYEISNEYIDIMHSLEDSEGVISPEMETALEVNEKNLQVKAKGYVEIIKTKEALDYAVDLEIKRLQAIKKRNSNVMTELKNRLLNAVILFGDFEVGLTKFGTRTSKSLNIIDATKIPALFKIKTVTESVQKNELKKAMNEGLKVEGAEVIIKNNLSIK